MRMTLQKTSSNPLRWLAVLMVIGCFGLVAFGINALLAPCARHLTNPSDWLGNFLAWIIFTVVGWLIVFYRPHNRIGWLCLLVGLLGAALIAINQTMICVAEADPLPTRFVFRAWLNYAILAYVLIVTLICAANPPFSHWPFPLPTLAQRFCRSANGGNGRSTDCRASP